MFSILRRGGVASIRSRTALRTRAFSSSVAKRQERKSVADIFPEEDLPQTHQPWTDRAKAELEPGTPSENPHLNKLFHIAKTYREEKPAQTAEPRVHEKAPYEATDKEHLHKSSASIRLVDPPPAMTIEDIEKMFSAFGPIADISTRTLSGQKVVSITYEHPGDADRVVDSHEIARLSFHETPLWIRYGSLTRLGEPKKTIFVGNWAPEGDGTVEERVRALFGEHAKICAVRQIPGKPACFVEFESVEVAKKIIDLHELRPFRDNMYILRINYENPRKEYREPSDTLCIAGWTGSEDELLSFLPEYDGGNHVRRLRQASPRPDLPPLYFVAFEHMKYAERAMDHLKDVSEFRTAWAKKSGDRRFRDRYQDRWL